MNDYQVLKQTIGWIMRHHISSYQNKIQLHIRLATCKTEYKENMCKILTCTWATNIFPSQRPVRRSFDVFFDLPAPEQTVKLTAEAPVISDVIVLIVTSL